MCVSEWGQCLTLTENVSSFTPHLLRKGLSSSPNRWMCLLRVLCPVRRPVTTLDWVLLKNKNLALAATRVPEINSWACLWVLSRLCHLAQCWLIKQQLSLLCIHHLETPRDGSGLINTRPEPSLARSSAISLPRTPACPGTQKSPTAFRVWRWVYEVLGIKNFSFVLWDFQLTDFFNALVPVVALIGVLILCSKLWFISTYLVNYEILFLCCVCYRFCIHWFHLVSHSTLQPHHSWILLNISSASD